jgi:hypothetical protein
MSEPEAVSPHERQEYAGGTNGPDGLRLILAAQFRAKRREIQALIAVQQD